MTNPPNPKRRWYQYSLRSLFVLTTLVAVACSWYSVEMQKAAERRAAIAEIVKLGGKVSYYHASHPDSCIQWEYAPPGWFSWLRRFHGDERLGNAAGIQIDRRELIENFELPPPLPNDETVPQKAPQITDDDLVHLKDLTGLEFLMIRNTQITDDGLVHLKGLAKLKHLTLDSSQITDTGLVRLKGLTKLECLSLAKTQITDKGLVHLKGLTNLEYLKLSGTQITDAGLAHLKVLTHLERLVLARTQISDAGLTHLKGLAKLEYLNLYFTPISKKGVADFREALPNCGIRHLRRR